MRAVTINSKFSLPGLIIIAKHTDKKPATMITGLLLLLVGAIGGFGRAARITRLRSHLDATYNNLACNGDPIMLHCTSLGDDTGPSWTSPRLGKMSGSTIHAFTSADRHRVGSCDGYEKDNIADTTGGAFLLLAVLDGVGFNAESMENERNSTLTITPIANQTTGVFPTANQTFNISCNARGMSSMVWQLKVAAMPDQVMNANCAYYSNHEVVEVTIMQRVDPSRQVQILHYEITIFDSGAGSMVKNVSARQTAGIETVGVFYPVPDMPGMVQITAVDVCNQRSRPMNTTCQRSSKAAAVVQVISMNLIMVLAMASVIVVNTGL